MPAQTLFDDLAGAAGAPVNRPQLNAFVANAQAMNGLRTAETDDALLKAQQAVQALGATSRLHEDLANQLGPDGKPLYQGGAADTLYDELVGHFGNADQVNAGLLAGEHAGAAATLGNPALIGTPAATAAQQEQTGKIAGPTAVPKEYYTPPGTTPPDVRETPIGQATADEMKALGGLHSNQAAATSPGAFNLSPAQRAGLIAAAKNYIYNHVQPSYSAFGTNGPQRQAMAAYYQDAVGHLALDPTWNDPEVAAALMPKEGAPAAPGAAPALAPPNPAIIPLAEQGYKQWIGGPNGQAVRGYATLAQTMPLLKQAIDGLHNGSFVPGNSVYQAVAKMTGNAAPTLQTFAAFINGLEGMRALKGSGVFSEKDVAQLQNAFSPSASSEQNLTNYNFLLHALQKGELGLKTTYDAATRGYGGRVDGIPKFEDLMAGRLTGAPAAAPGAGPGAAPAGAPEMPPQQALALLKPGVQTHFRNGQTWTIENGKPVRVN